MPFFLVIQEDNENYSKNSAPVTIVSAHSAASVAALVPSDSSVSLEMSTKESDDKDSFSTFDMDPKESRNSAIDSEK